MTPRSLFHTRTRPSLYICASCASKIAGPLCEAERRWIGTKYLVKLADAEKAWEEKAELIRKGERQSMLSILEQRGLIQQITGSRRQLDKSLTDKRIGAYVGFDPTASSLHIGHMLPLMSLFWMYVHGYQAVTLLGGATAKIGDPSDRLKTREKVHSSTRSENLVKMHYQLKRMWINVEAYGRKYGYQWEWAWKRGLLNNTHWWNKLPFIEVLQTLGPGMRIGTMLGRDTVKNKMNQGDGMSFAEFTYPLLQAWDWWHMYLKRRIQMQIGGSDQYGNITAGIDAIKYLAANHPDPVARAQANDGLSAPPSGFTVPLLTTSSGEKFGKSAGNAVWLDPDQTSSFDLYGYFMKTPDADIEKYLRMFTFMPVDDINALMVEHWKQPSLRKAQHVLASEFLEIVHGEKIAKETRQQHETIWAKPKAILVGEEADKEEDGTDQKKVGQPTGFDLNTAPRSHVRLPAHLIYTKSIGKLLHACGLASSNAEGHRLATAHGVYIGGNNCSKVGPMADNLISWGRIDQWYPEKTKDFLIDGKLLFLRRGKANIRIIEVVPNVEYKKSGETFPGYGDSFWDGVNLDQEFAAWEEDWPVSDQRPANSSHVNEVRQDNQRHLNMPEPEVKRKALMERSRQRATPWRSQNHHYHEAEDTHLDQEEEYMRRDHVAVGGGAPRRSRDIMPYGMKFTGPQAKELEERRHHLLGRMKKLTKRAQSLQRREIKRETVSKDYKDMMQARFGDDWAEKVKGLKQEDRGKEHGLREVTEGAWTPLRERRGRGRL